MFPLSWPVHACPFCGSRQLVGVTVVMGVYLVQCARCGASGPHRSTPEAAQRRWNQRNLPEPLMCHWCEELFLPLDDYEQYCSPLCRDTAEYTARRRIRPVRHRTLRALVGQGGRYAT